MFECHRSARSRNPFRSSSTAHSLQVCAGFTVLRQHNFRILGSLFRTTLTPAIRRYTCHALTSAGFFRISRYFVRKLYSIFVKIRKNPYTWRLWPQSTALLFSLRYLRSGLSFSNLKFARFIHCACSVSTPGSRLTFSTLNGLRLAPICDNRPRRP